MIHFFRTPFGAIVLVSFLITFFIIIVTDEPFSGGAPSVLGDQEALSATDPLGMANTYNRRLLQEYHKIVKQGAAADESSLPLEQRAQRAATRYYGEILQTRLDRNALVGGLPALPPHEHADASGGNLTAVQWADFAYVTYATSGDYLCAALMLFEQLRSVHRTPARLALLYPRAWGYPTTDLGQLAREQEAADALARGKSRHKSAAAAAAAVRAAKAGAHVTRMLRAAKEKYNVDLIPVKPLSMDVARRIVKDGGALSGADLGAGRGADDADENDDSTWRLSFTKILAFNQTQYRKLVVLDSDAYLMHSLDYLFFQDAGVAQLTGDSIAVDAPAGEAPAVAGPSPYWLLSPDHTSHVHDGARAPGIDTPLEFSSMLEVVTPSAESFGRILSRLAELHAAQETLQAHEEREVFYDMELVNHVFANVSLPTASKTRKHHYLANRSGKPNSYGVLDHRGLVLLTGELAKSAHEQYLTGFLPGAHKDTLDSATSRAVRDAVLWHPAYAVSTSAYIHFSDWPFPKPWAQATAAQLLAAQPACFAVPRVARADGAAALHVEYSETTGRNAAPLDCTARRVWNTFYVDYSVRRARVCELELST